MMNDLYINGLPSSVLVRQNPVREIRKESKRSSGLSVSTPSVVQLTAPDENKLAEGLKIFKSLFGQRQKIAGATYMDADDLFDANNGAQAQNGVLMSIPLDPDAAVKPYKSIVTNLVNRFKDVTAERLRLAYPFSKVVVHCH